MPYVAKDSPDTLHIEYTRSELLDILVNTSMSEVPYAITELIKGNHDQYIRPYLVHKLERNNGPLGMRISVYCADQTAYHSEKVLQLRSLSVPKRVSHQRCVSGYVRLLEGSAHQTRNQTAILLQQTSLIGRR